MPNENPYVPPGNMDGESGSKLLDDSQGTRSFSYAKLALLLSCSTFLTMGLVPGFIPGIILGHIALRQCKRDLNIRGAGYARAALVIGYGTIVLMLLALVLMFLVMFLQYHFHI